MTDLSPDMERSIKPEQGMSAPSRPRYLPAVGTLAYRRLSLAAILAIPLFLFTINFNVAREFSNLPFALALVLSGVICIIARRLELSLTFAVFAAYATAILALSLAGLMPEAWTQNFDHFAAIRHWLWIPALITLTTAFIVLFGRLQTLIIRRALVFAVLIYLNIQLASWLFDLGYTLRIYDVDNHVIPLTVALILFIFRTRRDPRIDAALIIIFTIIAESASQQLLGLSMLAIRFAPREHWVVLAVAIGIGITLILAPSFAPLVDQYDDNIGVRAIMWGDAIDATVETNGIGVGYGTEYIRNQFYAIRAGDWQVADPNHEGFLFLSTHSTPFDILLRLGVVGLLMTAVWLSTVILPRRRMGRQNRKAHGALACAFVIFTAFNPTLISFNALFGTACALAWMRLLENQPTLLSNTMTRRT